MYNISVRVLFYTFLLQILSFAPGQAQYLKSGSIKIKRNNKIDYPALISSPSFQTMTDTVYPQNVSYWTGTTTETSMTDTSEVRTLFPEVGWMVFDISAIPQNAVILDITFYGYVNATDYPYWSATPLYEFPVNGNPANIFNYIYNTGMYEQDTTYIWANENSNFTTGWHLYPLINGAVANLQYAVNTSMVWFAMGLMDRDDPVYGFFITFDGWAQQNPPYLVVNYDVATPVELMSFTATADNANAVLNWQTATETNNKGFEILRSQKSKVKSQNGWGKIGFVEGHGTSTKENSYTYSDKNLESGNYSYKMVQVDFDGSRTESKVINVEINALPTDYVLKQNYPNPFNPTTTIEYSIPSDGYVELTVFNATGQKVKSLVNANKPAGTYKIEFNASSLSSGIYFYKIKSRDFNSVKKMVLLR